jgi:MFS family permease
LRARLGRTAAQTFRSLAVRNYRLYFFGQLVSMSGTWMQSVAQGWLVLRLTHDSGFALGLVTALQFLPVLLVGAWGGVIADRFDKRRTLLCTQTSMAVFAAILAAVTLAGVVQLWMVYATALLLGLGNAIDSPTRQAFVSEMVGPEDLPNAIGLNSAIFNGARVIGPAGAGILITLIDVGPCFAINAVSFAAVIGALWRMRPAELARQVPVARAPGQVRAGLAYAWRTPELRSTLLLVTVVGTFALNYGVVLPLLAKVTFHGDAGTYGLISSGMGLGALVGALATAARKGPTPRLLVTSCIAFGALLTAASVAPTLSVALPILVLSGAGGIVFMATANSTLQLRSSPEMRGRVMALYVLVFLGSTPVGGPLIGLLCQHLGPRVGLGLGGIFTVVAGMAGAAPLLRRRRAAAAAAGTGGAPYAVDGYRPDHEPAAA